MTTHVGADGASAGAAKPDRSGAAAAVRLRAFVTRHGVGCVAVINHVGRMGARIVVIAPSGEYGDALAPSQAVAESVCAAIGLPIRDWDREISGLFSPSRAERVQMGTRRR